MVDEPMEGGHNGDGAVPTSLGIIDMTLRRAWAGGMPVKRLLLRSTQRSSSRWSGIRAISVKSHRSKPIEVMALKCRHARLTVYGVISTLLSTRGGSALIALLMAATASSMRWRSVRCRTLVLRCGTTSGAWKRTARRAWRRQAPSAH